MDGDQIPFLKSANLTCSDMEDLLSCYVDGEMITPLQLRFEAHLEHCDACRELVHDCQHLLRTAMTLDDASLADDIRHRLRTALHEKVGFPIEQCKLDSRPRLSIVKGKR